MGYSEISKRTRAIQRDEPTAVIKSIARQTPTRFRSDLVRLSAIGKSATNSSVVRNIALGG